MTAYRYVFAKTAQKDLQKLSPIVRKRIAKKLAFYIAQDDPLQFARPLVGDAVGEYRFRIGHYRVVFDVEGKTLIILSIVHRREAYRRK